MADAKRTESLSVAETPSDAITDRQQKLETLYLANYGWLTDTIADRALTYTDVEQIASDVAKYLPAYDSALTDAAFREWAADIIRPAKLFYGMVRQHSKVIHSAIWRTLGHGVEANRYGDDSQIEQEIYGTVLLKIMEKLDDLMQPGTAQLSTRLFALARLETLGWLKEQKVRHRAVRRRIESGGGFEQCEVLSEPEIRELKRLEREESEA